MVSCRKMADPIEMPFGTKKPVGQRNHVLGEGADPPRERGNLRGHVPHHCKVKGENMVSCRRTADPIEMLFGTKTRVGQGNNVLGGGGSLQEKGQLWGMFLPFKCFVIARALKMAI